ncbi:hypothetical protein KIPB_012838, partial [Kipferlia bialata]
VDLLKCGVDSGHAAVAVKGEVVRARKPMVIAGWESDAHKIIYANPAKMEDALIYAADNNINLTVFDGEDELRRMAAIPGQAFECVLRLATEDSSSVCKFSAKFGADVNEAEHLLTVAKDLGLKVVGVSFHTGSGCGDVAAYRIAMEHALRVFQTAEALGMPPLTLVDIGGGFPGDMSGYGGPGMPTFQEIAAQVRESVDSFCEALDATPMHIPTTGFGDKHATGRQ